MIYEEIRNKKLTFETEEEAEIFGSALRKIRPELKKTGFGKKFNAEEKDMLEAFDKLFNPEDYKENPSKS